MRLCIRRRWNVCRPLRVCVYFIYIAEQVESYWNISRKQLDNTKERMTVYRHGATLIINDGT